MVNVVRRRRGAAERRLPFGAAAEHYASMGWPVCAGAHPYRGTRASMEPGRACSCDRIGCPAPGAHRDSYVLVPPSACASGLVARWIRSPREHPLPDALRLLEYLVDACED